MEGNWRCSKYGPLVWIECIVKLLAIGVAFAALSIVDKRESFRVNETKTRLAQIILMGISGGVHIAIVVIRVLDKELLAIFFQILHLFAHWMMLLVLALSQDPGSWIFTYVFLAILGEFIRMMFLFMAENVNVHFINKPILLIISLVLALIQIAVLIIQVVKWLTEYKV